MASTDKPDLDRRPDDSQSLDPSIGVNRDVDNSQNTTTPPEMSQVSSTPIPATTVPATSDPLSTESHASNTGVTSQDAQADAGPNRARATSSAIGPSVDDDVATPTITNILQPTTTNSPAVLITLILLNGARHPFKIDEKYLRKRNVVREEEGDVVDPFAISVYTLKELIWRDWREEWEPRPSNPGAIRLFHFGKRLEDKQTLTDVKLNPTTPNAVHMSVRPQDFDDEEPGKAGKGSSRRGIVDEDEEEEQAGCCRCVVM